MTAQKAAPPRRRGRPHAKDPAKTYAGLSYVVTTFRLKKRTVAEADAITEALGLGSRTNAVQYAVGQVFRQLRNSKTMSRNEIDDFMKARLAEYEL